MARAITLLRCFSFLLCLSVCSAQLPKIINTTGGSGGGGGTPGGADGDLQYKQGSGFGGSSAFHVDPSSPSMTITAPSVIDLSGGSAGTALTLKGDQAEAPALYITATSAHAIDAHSDDTNGNDGAVALNGIGTEHEDAGNGGYMAGVIGDAHVDGLNVAGVTLIGIQGEVSNSGTGIAGDLTAVVANVAAGTSTNARGFLALTPSGTATGEFVAFKAEGGWGFGLNSLSPAQVDLSAGEIADSALSLIGNSFSADLSIRDPSTLGAETLTNGAFTGGTSWTATGDCSLTGDAATCTFSSGFDSEIIQAQADLVQPLIPRHWYSFQYTVSGITGTGQSAFLAGSTPSAVVSLDLTEGTHTLTFLTSDSPGDFDISTDLTDGQSFTLDNVSLKPIVGGQIIAQGEVQALHFTGNSVPPTLSCGTAVANSSNTDISGTIDTGAGSACTTSVVVTFANPTGVRPHCVVSQELGTLAVFGYSNDANALTITATALSGLVDYICTYGPGVAPD